MRLCCSRIELCFVQNHVTNTRKMSSTLKRKEHTLNIADERISRQQIILFLGKRDLRCAILVTLISLFYSFFNFQGLFFIMMMMFLTFPFWCSTSNYKLLFTFMYNYLSIFKNRNELKWISFFFWKILKLATSSDNFNQFFVSFK